METSTSTQIGLSVIALGNLVTSGMSVAFPAVALPALEAVNDIKVHQASWIGSIAQLTMIVGSFAIGPIIDNFGRRMSFIVAVVPSLIGWITIGWSYHIGWFYIGRLFTGLSMGFSSAPTAVFLAEITSPALRAPITVAKNIAFSLGLTIMYIIGLIFKDDWCYMALAASFVPALTLILSVKILPESKVWEEQASSTRLSYRSFIKEYKTRPEVYLPFIIMNFILILRQLSGTSVILTYTLNMVNKMGIQTNPYHTAIGIGLARMLAGVIAAWLSKRYGRRKPVAFSGTVMSFTMICLAQNLQIGKLGNDSLIQATVLIVFIISSTIFTAITQSIVGEIFPTDVRGVCSGLTSCTTYITAFFVLMTYPWLSANLEKHELFMLYASLCVTTAIVTIMLLPETNGKTLKEIQLLFTREGENTTESEINRPLNSEALKTFTSSP